MVLSYKLPALLEAVSRIIKQEAEIERIKGEKFNIFSVLKMESKENGTHSAFLVELLNPKGTHLKGPIFLQLFLENLNLQDVIHLETAKVSAEVDIGPLDEANKTGGRIDIYLWDRKGNTICIENKIYAGDQKYQIERYCNYIKDKSKGKVIYLNLHGCEPSDGSKGKLTNGNDFHVISYKSEIKRWLEACLKECSEQPILRETIRQYLILIKKMTSTTDNQHQAELLQLLAANLQEASFVSSNFEKAKQLIAENVRQTVIKQLSNRLNDLTIAIGKDISEKYAQVWVYLPEFGHKNVCFGIEAFNGLGNYGGDLYIGIFNPEPNSISSYGGMEKSEGEHWSLLSFITFEGSNINLGNTELLAQIQSDTDFTKRLIDSIVEFIIQYIIQHKANLHAWLVANTRPELNN
ncbi:PDDEXK-like family protein [Flavitalea sp.]|nr:PD-(D/E)XK nuclease family protein [Flavitalea sp.]